MNKDWKINKITALAEHSSGLRCSLSLDTIHKDGLRVMFLNEHTFKTIDGNSDEMMRNLGQEYIEMVKENCPRFAEKPIRVWTTIEENIQRNKDKHHSKELGKRVLLTLAKSKGRDTIW